MEQNESGKLDLANDIHTQNFNVIRLASYRTAVKFRFIQRRTHLHLIDVWNLIEAFRENGLNSVEPYTPMTLSRLETLINTLYVHLNKRVPIGQQLHVDPATMYLIKWIVSVYSLNEETDRIPVFTIKMILAVLCGGKLADKLRYAFSQMSDSNGQLVAPKFEDFMRQCFVLTAAVGEEPSFHYRPAMAQEIFPNGSKVSVNEFLDVLLGDPAAAPSLVWLPLIHRIAAAENVVHPVECVSCGRTRFSGLRYKCTKCPSAWSHQCQECFWRGLSFSESHNADHEIREHHTPAAEEKTPKESVFSASLRRSLQCVRSPTSDYDQNRTKVWRTLEGPERPVAVTYISTPSATLERNASLLGGSETWKTSQVQNNTGSLSRSWQRGDDEHGLIARYAAKLAENQKDPRPEQESSSTSAHQLLAQLENKNQEILREIARIRHEQEMDEGVITGPYPLMEELSVLRQRKSELEQQLNGLQDSRKQLMVQLESLMKMIKNQQLSPRSTPSTSSTPSRGKSPSVEAESHQAAITPSMDNPNRNFNTGSFDWRQDLMSAADSVTDAMSSLVLEYNGDTSEDESARIFNGLSNDSNNTCV
ncbi:dystrobrevin beta-like isoform X1 [Daphnia pulicaria]|uniref:dystrobrevin beta-like isoform X1 n=1 Tax=Daphnia pulicaria TaxID=35523 RepID=UPI001EE9DF11|nr:dystrobrevin beta-like isoform X1 [Daphnia pulicaria]